MNCFTNTKQKYTLHFLLNDIYILFLSRSFRLYVLLLLLLADDSMWTPIVLQHSDLWCITTRNPAVRNRDQLSKNIEFMGRKRETNRKNEWNNTHTMCSAIKLQFGFVPLRVSMKWCFIWTYHEKKHWKFQATTLTNGKKNNR